MDSKEIMNRVLTCVSEVTDIPVEDIVSRSRREERVRARALICGILAQMGYSISATAEHLKTTYWVVHYMRGRHMELLFGTDMYSSVYKALYNECIDRMDMNSISSK